MDVVGVITGPARMGIRLGREGITLVVRGAGAVGGLLSGEPSRAESERPPEPAPSGPTVESPPRPAAPPPPAPREPPPDAETEPEPEHVDEQATLVAEFAEPGAEDGAGAELELSEPWEGYDGMHVDEVLPRLGDASTEALAAVVLYERTARDRAAVIEEAERQLRGRSAPGST
jgi:hypothetical protein